MLHLPLKTTERVDLHRALHRLVSTAYSDQQAEDHREAFQDAAALREKVRQVALTEKSVAEGVRLLARYHRLLTTMRSRFGTDAFGSGSAEPTPLFAWRDALRPAEVVSHAELGFEMAGVLFNLAAALSYTATTEDRTSPTGLRAACQAFQQAAGAIDALAAVASGDAWAGAVDVHPKALAAWSHVMLAQAQQCFYEKVRRPDVGRWSPKQPPVHPPPLSSD